LKQLLQRRAERESPLTGGLTQLATGHVTTVTVATGHVTTVTVATGHVTTVTVATGHVTTVTVATGHVTTGYGQSVGFHPTVVTAVTAVTAIISGDVSRAQRRTASAAAILKSSWNVTAATLALPPS
jgi:hypothetical protein